MESLDDSTVLTAFLFRKSYVAYCVLITPLLLNKYLPVVLSRDIFPLVFFDLVEVIFEIEEVSILQPKTAYEMYVH